jgi:hypothetical protein
MPIKRPKYIGHRAVKLRRELVRIMSSPQWRLMIVRRRTEAQLPRMRNWNRLAKEYLELRYAR